MTADKGLKSLAHPGAHTSTTSTTSGKDSLKFKVAPHIVEDLGLNLYTNLPRVLVEYIANAYDADATYSKIFRDQVEIEKARGVLKKEYEADKAKYDADLAKYEAAKGKKDSKLTKPADLVPLASRILPPEHTIVIEDDGCGMSRTELDEKFLVAGRRRRQMSPEDNGRTPNGRLLMGRKGLGKLAGFGVAKHVVIETRKKGEKHATRITLSYESLVKNKAAHEIVVPDEPLADGGGFKKSGTRIILSQLLYEPLKAREATIEHEIADHFELIDPKEFSIKLNNKPVKPQPLNHAFAWPNEKLPKTELVDHKLPREGGGEVSFSYRIRFTGDEQALPAARRGIRVYAHKRLAAAPSLLGADTNMHGFRMTDYMDGVVHADFLDDEDSDYVATDRQSLRWETPLLWPLHQFLSEKIKEACKHYQAVRDEKSRKIVRDDKFTKGLVNGFDFSNKDKTMAFKVATILKGACKQGVKDPVYQEKLPILLQGISHGNILTAISQLASQEMPDLGKVATEVANLTKDEFDQFITSAKARLKALAALRKIVEAVDFKGRKQEKLIQKMFEECPWMIDGTYTHFLSANQPLDTVFNRLAKELKVWKYAPKNGDQTDRPDLVYFIGNSELRRLVIVELKAANLPLNSDHLDQLLSYIRRAKAWLANKVGEYQVHGHLIGSFASEDSRDKKVLALQERLATSGPDTAYKVRDFVTVLTDAEATHGKLVLKEKQSTAADED